MLGDKVLKLLGSESLSLTLIVDVIIVPDNLLTTFPIHLNDVVHKLTFAFQLLLDLSVLFLQIDFLFLQMLLAMSDHPLGITVFLLCFFVEIISHPLQFFQQIVPMALRLVLRVYFSLVLEIIFRV